MTSLLEGAATPVVRGTEIGDRVKALDAAVTAGRGRLDEAALEQGRGVVTRAAERLRLSADHTVVALGGATGSGKSSTFNALVGLDLASVGVRRPTTSWATACTWGVKGAAELLEWLGIPPRHQVVRDSLLDTGREAKDLEGLVLVDLPDHDSTEVSHHLEVERLVRLADVLVWVLDPQKYADAAIHDRFLKPLAAHAEVMMIVLNHIDEVREDRRPAMIADLRRLLDADGLAGIPLIAISAADGTGVDELRREIIRRVAEKAATRARITTGVAQASAAIASVHGSAKPPGFAEVERADLREAIREASGVPVVVEAAQRAVLARGRRATAGPLAPLLRRLGRDRGDADLDAEDRELAVRAMHEVPQGDQAQAALIDAAVRFRTDRLSEGLTRPWTAALRRSGLAGVPELERRVSAAVAEVDLGTDASPVWARLMSALQLVLLLVGLAGGLWWAGSGVLSARPYVGGMPLPFWLLLGGLGLSLGLVALCRLLVGRAAARRAAAVEKALGRTVQTATDELVIAPLAAELDAYRVVTDALRAAQA